MSCIREIFIHTSGQANPGTFALVELHAIPEVYGSMDASFQGLAAASTGV
jgi:hypothetical protein